MRSNIYAYIRQRTVSPLLLKDFRTGNRIIVYKVSTVTYTHRSSYEITSGLHVSLLHLWRKTAELEFNFNFISPDVFHIKIKYIHSSNIFNIWSSTQHYNNIFINSFGIPKCSVIKRTCSYVRPDNGPGGPKLVVWWIRVKGCRCVGWMYILYFRPGIIV
jgi:hypothetical protein